MQKHLTSEQVAHYHRNGYVFPVRALDDDGAAAARETLEKYERDTGRSAQKTLAFKAHLPFRHFCELVRHPRILVAVEDVIGPNILCWGSSLFVKEPHDPHFISWHADTYYYTFEPADTCTAWLAFTPSNRRSGCVRVIPGSHLEDTAFDNVPGENNMLPRGQTARDVDESKSVYMVLEPGEFSMHHECVVHGSDPNASGDRRIGYSIHYCAPSVRQVQPAEEGPPLSAALVRGEDTHGHWEPEPMTEAAYDPAAYERLVETRKRFWARGR